MDRDVQDLIVAWHGGDVEPARREELLARLRQDAEFRQAFAAELQLYGQLKAVQSPEPRWLELEDEVGWHAQERAGDERLEENVLAAIRGLRWWHMPGLAQWGLAGAVAAVVAIAAVLLLWPSSERSSVAVVADLDGVSWDISSEQKPAEGDVVTAGRLRFRSGNVTLAFLNGVTMYLSGPADVDLVGLEKVFCHVGRLRAVVPPGAEGFTVTSPGTAITDLGTEFGVNIARNGRSEVMVFKGKAEVSLLNKKGQPARSELLVANKAAVLNPKRGEIRQAVAREASYVSAKLRTAPALPVGKKYIDAIRQAGPWSYWRFESLDGDVVANEIADGAVLHSVGPITLAGTEGNHTAVFGTTNELARLDLDGEWAPSTNQSFSFEAWVLPTQLNAAAVVAAGSGVAENSGFLHSLLLQLNDASPVPARGRVRYLYRYPPANGGGVNIYSKDALVPNRWYHLVMQRRGAQAELFVNGELAGAIPIDVKDIVPASRLVFGRIGPTTNPNPQVGRQFVGQLDEVAIYNRALTAAEVQQHYRLIVPAAAVAKK